MNANSSKETIKFQIQGMTCTACVSSIEQRFFTTPGIFNAQISLLSERAEIEYDPILYPKPEMIYEMIDSLGFTAIPISENEVSGLAEFIVHGMTCSNCSQSIVSGLLSLPGIKNAQISLTTEKAKVHYDPNQIGIRDILEKVQDLGFEAFMIDSSSAIQISSLTRTEEIIQWRKSLLYCLWFFIPEFLLSHVFNQFDFFHPFLMFQCPKGLFLSNIIELCLTIPVQFGIGKRFYISAWKALSNKHTTMDVLISVSSSFAFGFSIISMIYSLFNPKLFENHSPMLFFDTSTMLITFVMLGKYLENLAKGKTSSALAKLYHMKPSFATLVTAEAEKKISVDLIQIGDHLKVFPGEKIPADGVVVSGESTVDESLITGEAVPVIKRPGSQVIGGTLNSSAVQSSAVNNHGVLIINTTKVGNDTALAQIIQLIENAQISKPPIQSFADFISGFFVPLVILISMITFFVWMYFLTQTEILNEPILRKMLMISQTVEENPLILIYVALRFAMAVIVVACPCALGLATPTAVMVGTGVGASLGAFIKGGLVLEKSHKMSHIIFDKTGTLTEGKLSVNQIRIHQLKISKELFYFFCGLAESQSEHPFATCIVKEAKKQLQQPETFAFHSFMLKPEDAGLFDIKLDGPTLITTKINSFKSETGAGIECHFTISLEQQTFNFSIFLGNEKFMTGKELQQPPVENQPNVTTVFVALKTDVDVIYGNLFLQDTVKPEAPAVIDALNRILHIKTFMVTGDQWESAQSVAQKCGIPETNVFAGVSPAGKKLIIEAIQKGSELDTFRVGQMTKGQSQMTLEEDEQAVNFSLWSQLLLLLSRQYNWLRHGGTVYVHPYQEPTHHIVGMVGDGINDSAALAQADVGMALCSGSDIAMEASDIVLMTQPNSESSMKNLLLVPTTIELTHYIMKRIRLNFIWATLYNLIALPMAAGIFIRYGIMIHPVMAAGMMAMSSISVILNSLLLKNYQPKQWLDLYSKA